MKNTSMLHMETANVNGYVLSGYIINKAIQTAILSVFELCEASLETQTDEDGNTKRIDTAELAHHIRIHSTDLVKFVKAAKIG